MFGRNFISSVFMVSGCAMGAGCLAIPLVASGTDFLLSSFSLVLIAIFSYWVAIYSVEIFILYKNDANISTIVKKNFGSMGLVINGLINGLFMYALLSVYMTGGADLLNKTILPLININISDNIALLLFLVIFLPFFFRGAVVISITNKYIFYLKLISFLLVIFLGLLDFRIGSLLNLHLNNIKYIPHALPIFFGGLWFHLLIPIIARLNNYDRARCRLIFSVGLIIPLILYILWIGVMLNLIPRDGDTNSFYFILHNGLSVGSMISIALQNPHASNGIKFFLNCFSNIALLTSFLTVGLSTYDYVRDFLQIKQTHSGIIKNIIITMLPPCFFAIFLSNGFVFILQQAITLLLLTNSFNLICVIKEYNNLAVKPNKKMLYVLLGLLIIFILLPILDNLSLLPSFGVIV